FLVFSTDLILPRISFPTAITASPCAYPIGLSRSRPGARERWSGSISAGRNEACSRKSSESARRRSRQCIRRQMRCS
ncbi:MAG: hypothetical protein ACK55Z_32875, partial [bacterium]